MHIHSIEFSNIFCFGNQKITVDYDNLGDGSLNMIIGKNGCGKSSFIKLHKLALYFESDGVLLNGISNDINGSGYVAIEVSSNGHRWRVASHYTRTKLNTIEVFKDGSDTPEDWGKIPDTKAMINQQIIDIPYHIFSNILSLSINDFKSFLSMNPKDTRNIRDRIFGFYVLNDMMENLKVNMKSYADRYSEINSKVTSLNEIIEDTNRKIETEQQQLSLHSDAEKVELQNKILECQSRLKEQRKSLSTLEQSKSQYQLLMNYYRDLDTLSLINSFSNNISELQASIIKLKEQYEAGSSVVKAMEADVRTYELKESLKVYELVASRVRQQQEKFDIIDTVLKKSTTEIQRLEAAVENVKFVKNYNSVVESVLSKASAIKTLLLKIKELSDLVKIKEDAGRELQASVDKHTAEVKASNDKISALEKENSLYLQKKCPTCGNNFETAEFQQKVVANETEISKLKEIIKQREEVIASIKLDVQSVSNELSQAQRQLNDCIRDRDVEWRSLTAIVLPAGNSNVESSEQYQKFRALTDNLVGCNYEVLEQIASVDDYVITSVDDTAEQQLSSALEQQQKLNEEKIALSAEISSSQSTLSQYDDTVITTAREATYKLQELTDEIITSYKQQCTEKETEVQVIDQLIKDKEAEIATIAMKIDNLRNGVSTIEYYKERIQPEIFKITKEELNTVISSVSDQISTINANVQACNDELISLNSRLSSIVEVSKSKLQQLEQLRSEYIQKSEELNKEERKVLVNINFLKIIEYTLSDEGIKSYIIKELVPAINCSIGEILSQLEIPLVVKFDNEFKPTIYRFGEPVSIASISTGQTKMIDSAITFTITRLLLSKCNGINVVFYDEIFSSLHSSAVTTMMEIISNELVKGLGLHVFLVNHSYISSSFFDNIFEFYYKDNFSNIDIQTVEEYNKKLL